jgi:polyphenol oxidase
VSVVTAPYETFPSLDSLPGFRHGFLQRVPGLAVEVAREEALARLRPHHLAAIAQIGLVERRFITAEQIHHHHIARVDRHTSALVAGCDGLLTDDPTVALGIYTADCGALYLVDPIHRAIGLLHSGKKGTELAILSLAIAAMRDAFGSAPHQLVVQLAPCIRPPHYEIDFAADIARQARSAGVVHYQDSGACTAANLEKYYSYRREKGQTGRLLAVLGYAS